jgi:hypothetical protein
MKHGINPAEGDWAMPSTHTFYHQVNVFIFSSQRDISNYLNSRDILSNVPPVSFANIPSSSRDILSYTPTSSRDVLSTYSNRDYSHSAAMVARELSASYGSRDILSTYATSQDVTSSNNVVSVATSGA